MTPIGRHYQNAKQSEQKPRTEQQYGLCIVLVGWRALKPALFRRPVDRGARAAQPAVHAAAETDGRPVVTVLAAPETVGALQGHLFVVLVPDDVTAKRHVARDAALQALPCDEVTLGQRSGAHAAHAAAVEAEVAGWAREVALAAPPPGQAAVQAPPRDRVARPLAVGEAAGAGPVAEGAVGAQGTGLHALRPHQSRRVARAWLADSVHHPAQFVGRTPSTRLQAPRAIENSVVAADIAHASRPSWSTALLTHPVRPPAGQVPAVGTLSLAAQPEAAHGTRRQTVVAYVTR